MSLPPDLLDQSPPEAVRRIALDFLDEAQAASDRLDDETDVEALHDFRVAIRRLRSTVRSWRRELKGSVGKRHVKALRKLQDATGGGRDAEVALAWLETQRSKVGSSHKRGFDWMVDRLDRRRRASMSHVLNRVKREFAWVQRQLRERLEVMTITVHLGRAPQTGTTFGQAFAERIRAQADEVVHRIERALSPDDQLACHAARIATKRLRYLVEPIRPFAKEGARVVKLCKRLQDTLGELNDSHVLQVELSKGLEVTAVEHARRLQALVRDEDEASLRRETRRAERPGLIELSRRVHNRTRELYAAFEEEWLIPRAAVLLDAVERLSIALETASRTGLEIERKFLLREMPELPEDSQMIEIDQGWLPGERLVERMRRTRCNGSVEYFRTVKVGRGLQRLELEESATKPVFERMWTLTEGCRIHKRRFKVPDGDLVWEIDQFVGLGLVLAEVELPNPELKPTTPAWLAGYVVTEVTEDDRYTNLSLARRTSEAGA